MDVAVLAQNLSTGQGWTIVSLLGVFMSAGIFFVARIDRKVDRISEKVSELSERVAVVETVATSVAQSAGTLDTLTSAVQGISDGVAELATVGKKVDTLKGMTTELATETKHLGKYLASRDDIPPTIYNLQAPEEFWRSFLDTYEAERQPPTPGDERTGK